ncbi:MAG: hypothetical protein ABII71_06040 [Candidatus Micrarchaeota archaeon]
MAAIDAGSNGILRKGRRAGEEVEILALDGKFATIKTKKGKERKVAVTQLDPA